RFLSSFRVSLALRTLHSFPTRRSSDLLGAFAFKSAEIEINLLKAMPAVFGLTPKFVDDPMMAMIFPLRSVAIAAGTLTLLALYRSEEHTSELQSRSDLVCRLLLEKKKQ